MSFNAKSCIYSFHWHICTNLLEYTSHLKHINHLNFIEEQRKKKTKKFQSLKKRKRREQGRVETNRLQGVLLF